MINKSHYKLRKFNIQRVFLAICFIGCTGFSQNVSADHPVFGPRLVIGCGLSGLRLQSRPDWTAKYYGGGIISGAVRLYEGLSAEAGKEYGFGTRDPRADWVDYGEGVRLWTKDKTYNENSWLGLQYEIPLGLFSGDFFGINFICASLGMNYTKYGIRSDVLLKGDIREELDRKEKFRTATLSGPYAAIAARWRFDTVESEEKGSWFGAYGLDIGVRYTRYNKSSLRHDNVMEPKSNFNCFQLFMVGFLKIKLLY